MSTRPTCRVADLTSSVVAKMGDEGALDIGRDRPLARHPVEIGREGKQRIVVVRQGMVEGDGGVGLSRLGAGGFGGEVL